MNISITISDITSSAKNRLSIIAKRAQTEKGNPSFVNITLGSAEIGILNELASDGADYLSAELAVLVSSFARTSDKFMFNIKDDRTIEVAKYTLESSIKSYITNHVLAEYLSMYSKEYADTFVNKRQADIDNLLELAYSKKPFKSNREPDAIGSKLIPALFISEDVITAHVSDEVQEFNIYMQVKQGGKAVRPNDYTVSRPSIVSPDGMIGDSLVWEFGANDTTFYYTLYLLQKMTANVVIPFKVTYGVYVFEREITFNTVE